MPTSKNAMWSMFGMDSSYNKGTENQKKASAAILKVFNAITELEGASIDDNGLFEATKKIRSAAMTYDRLRKQKLRGGIKQIGYV